MKKLLTIVMVLLAFAYNLSWAGTTGKLAGRVVNKLTAEPLPGVNVFLDGTVLGATTDLDGNYVILNISPGNYTILVQYVGFQEIKMENVPISIDLTTRRDFELIENTLELDEVIVVEGRRAFVQKDITSSQSSVSSEEMNVLPVVEMEDVLQLQAGVTRDAGGNFHIRGGRSSEISYWANGVSITDAYDNSQGVEIDNNSIQELQVISGTFNAEYGNAMSGIINMVTKEGSKQYSGDVQIYSGDYLSNFTDYFTNIDDFNPVENYDFRGSLSGPVPFTKGKVTFFATGRYNYDDGHLYGERRFSTTGDTLGSVDENGKVVSGDPVSMSWSEKITGQGKIAYWPTSTIKLNAELLYSQNDYEDYDHSYKWEPDGSLTKHTYSYNALMTMTHTLSPKTFYTMNVSYFFKEFKERLYDSPFDSRYTHPDSLNTINLAFRTKGTNLHRFYRETNTLSLKSDLTSQMTKNHLLKSGVEAKFNDLYLDDYNLEPLRVDNVEVDPFKPSIPSETSPNRTKYSYDPVEFAAYMQDKIEYDDVIINVGFRLDYFDSRGKVLVDPRDPNIYVPLRDGMDTLSLAEREPYYYKDAEPKWQVSPRFGIAYPITETGVVHFSYGHFLQIPSYTYLYNLGGYKVPETGNYYGVYGNADLEAQKTVMYEIGVQQGFLNDFRIDVTGFYRDVRDWITSSAFTSTISGVKYSTYVNKDYANVKGITLALKKRYSQYYSFDISYTYQITEGSNSTPEEDYNAQQSNSEPALFLIPMDWDQRHLLNASLYVGAQTWGGSVIAQIGSGLPYTPSITQYTSDRGLSTGLDRNSRRRPSQFTLDLKLHKSFMIYQNQFTAFLRVFNLLDNQVVVNVFTDTGDPDYTTENQNVQEDPDRPNTVDEYQNYPWHYGEPREVQLGLEWSF